VLPGLPKLTTLDLALNVRMDAAAIVALAPGLPPNLQVLDLGQCQMEVAGVAALAPRLPPTLRVLRLSGCYIRDAGAAALAAALPRLPALTSLDVSSNALTAAGLRDLVRVLPPTFQELYLDRNRLGFEGAAVIAAELPRLPALRVLKLYKCNIGDEGIHALIPAVRGHSELRFLDLGGFLASEDTLDALVAILPSLPKLEMLGYVFDDNGPLFTEKVGEAFPEKYTDISDRFRGVIQLIPNEFRTMIPLRPPRRERRHRTSRRRSTRRRSTRRRSTRRRSTRRRSTRRRLTRRND
jgi:hypothetical protein